MTDKTDTGMLIPVWIPVTITNIDSALPTEDVMQSKQASKISVFSH